MAGIQKLDDFYKNKFDESPRLPLAGTGEFNIFRLADTRKVVSIVVDGNEYPLAEQYNCNYFLIVLVILDQIIYLKKLR